MGKEYSECVGNLHDGCGGLADRLADGGVAADCDQGARRGS